MDEVIATLSDPNARLLVLTGAGVSAESGLATFRGTGGLWEGWPVESVATPTAFERDPALVWRFYDERRRRALLAEPNAAHRDLAAVERRMGDRFMLVTQNVDGLHQAAGSERVIPLHGSLWHSRCNDCGHRRADRAIHETVPVCSRCGGYERPDIVWFGEQLNPKHFPRIARFLARADDADEPLVFLAVGTSGVVSPASLLVQYARGYGAETWLNNLEGGAQNASAFDHIVSGPATEIVGQLTGVVV